MAYTILRRRWRARRMLWYMLPAELAAIVACLAMFGIAQPDTYRTELWEIGGKEHFNSRPSYLLYFYANYRPVPATPFVWSQTLTDFNVAISIISLFVLIAKLVLIIMRIWWPIYSVLVHTALLVMYVVSMYGQMGPDHLDPRYPSNIAWYLREGCAPARKYGAEKYCKMAQGTFAATVYMVVVLMIVLGIAVWSMLPNPANDIKFLDDDDDEEDETSSDAGREKAWELQGLRSPASPASPGARSQHVPYTPRTQAFHTLDRKLPPRYA